MNIYPRSLTIQFSTILIIAQVLVLSCISYIYIKRFSDQVDRRIEIQAYIPGELMSAGLLNINAMADRDRMENLVGTPLEEGMVIGSNSIVFYSINEENIGKSIEDLPLLVQQKGSELRKSSIRVENELITTTPIFASDGKTPRFYVYVTVNTEDTNAEKHHLLLIFIYGSLATLILTSLILFLLFKYIVFDRLLLIGSTLHKVEAGDLTARVDINTGKDEIGMLGRGVNTMATSLENTIIDLTTEITERKQAEKALRESEIKYRQLFENANDAIFIAQDGKIVFSNKRTSELLMYEDAEIRSTPFAEFIHPEDREEVVNYYIRRLKGESDVPDTYPFRARRKDHSELVLQLSSVLVEWDEGPATLNFARDITNQIKLEKSFYQAQKLEAIGTLAGGVAHDFNNLLMGIQGHSNLMSVKLSPDDPNFEHVKAIDKCIKSATSLTRQLLGTARGGKYDPKVIDLNTLVESSSKMFARTSKGIQTDLSLSESPVASEVDQQQIEQVLLNMYVNAWQAMGNGGELFLRTTVETLEESQILGHSDALPGQYSKISITDTGIGMDELTRQQIFDPFFTTKEKGRGTGLGLASAYGIVKNHKGFITVYSEVGHGTTFNIYLPHTTIKPSQETTEQSYIQTGTETVLLVDDESLILEVGRALLEELGYRVIAVNSGAKAIELIDGKSEGIDVVLLDLIMPGLDGRETFRRIREIDSSMPVILSSGYTINEEATDIMRRGCNGFIQKPYNLSALSKKVRSVLDQNNT